MTLQAQRSCCGSTYLRARDTHALKEADDTCLPLCSKAVEADDPYLPLASSRAVLLREHCCLSRARAQYCCVSTAALSTAASSTAA